MTMRLGEVGDAVEEIAATLSAGEDGDSELDRTEKRLIGLGIRAFGSICLHAISAADRIADALEARQD